MRIDFAPFWLQKDGAAPREYEDAFAPASVDTQPRMALRCAVADGASESAFARTWARLLAGGFAIGRLTAPDLLELSHLEQRWLRVAEAALSRNADAAWYLERKVEEGAFAAFVGLECRADPDGTAGGTYAAIALGDCCLVHVRADRVQSLFPLANEAAFHARPQLVPSRPASGDTFRDDVARVSGRWEAGDRFYLMSDALANWFYAALERGERPWRELDRFARHERAVFRRWIVALRQTRLKNDDVTLLRVRIGD